MTYYQKLGEITAEKLGNISVEVNSKEKLVTTRILIIGCNSFLQLTRIYATTNVESVAARIEEMLDGMYLKLLYHSTGKIS